MSDLFKKLNTLVRASLNDLTPSFPNRNIPPDVDFQVKELRGRINAAVEHEEHLAETVRILRAEVDRLDTAVDQAVTDGRDEAARAALEKLQASQKRLEMAESDLRAHQDVAQQLIERVNMLDAAVADARRMTQPDEPAPDAMQRVSDIIRETRDKINAVSERVSARLDGEMREESAPPPPASLTQTPRPTDDTRKDDDDDLSDRLKRLSK